jgi:hypothetical protein
MKASIFISQLISGKNIFPDELEVGVKKNKNYIVSRSMFIIYVVIGRKIILFQDLCLSVMLLWERKLYCFKIYVYQLCCYGKENYIVSRSMFINYVVMGIKIILFQDLCLSIYVVMRKEVMHIQISCSSRAE